MRIIWSERAVEDLEQIYNFVASKNKRAAIALYNSIIDEVEILLSFPEIAPILKQTEQLVYPLRGLLTKNKIYKVIYSIDSDFIYITQVWDCRRDPDTLI